MPTESKLKSSNTYRESFEDRRLRMPKPQDDVPDLSRKSSMISNMSMVTERKSTFMERVSETFSMRSSQAPLPPPKTSNDTINVTLAFNYEDYPTQKIEIKIHKTRDVNDLFERTQTWLTDNYNY